MPSRCCEFVDSRLRRSPPDRASEVPYGQAGENAIRFPHLAHRSAAAHKLYSTPQQHGMIFIPGNGEISSRLHAFSLFFPGSCPNNRDRRTLAIVSTISIPHPATMFPTEAIVNPPSRGSRLDADHPRNGVLIPCRFTASAMTSISCIS